MRLIRICILGLAVTALALAAGCQANRQASQPPPESAAPPPPQPNLRVTLAHAACARPPCPMGTVADLATGATTTVYDVDLDPLGLPDGERADLTRALFEDSYLVEGTVEPRPGYLGADGPVPVIVITAVIDPAHAEPAPPP
ncbi:MAG: hypothetical protein GVY13_15210 [Alphaproteobacteria bacterium]|jgi:hypothetical protein|nr:hypothetical protein [Alphaproteobacteria bacterium]